MNILVYEWLSGEKHLGEFKNGFVHGTGWR
jgi:hypothetical protein